MSKPWHELVKIYAPPLEPAQLASFEQILGCRLPQDYREFMLELNGGGVLVDHTIPLSESREEVGVRGFFQLNKEARQASVEEEWQRTQGHTEWGMPWALKIGDDGGTGFFLLAFRGELAGSVFFAWKEDYWHTSPGTEYLDGSRHPDEYQFVCRPFDALRKLIWRFREA